MDIQKEYSYAIVKHLPNENAPSKVMIVLEDEILAVNGYACQGELDQWLEMHDDTQKKLLVQRKGKIIELALPELQRSFYNVYSIAEMKSPNNNQVKAFESWKK